MDDRGQAVVFLPQGACGTGAEAPGVYLYRDAGKGRLLVPTRGPLVRPHVGEHRRGLSPDPVRADRTPGN